MKEASQQLKEEMQQPSLGEIMKRLKQLEGKVYLINLRLGEVRRYVPQVNSRDYYDCLC